MKIKRQKKKADQIHIPKKPYKSWHSRRKSYFFSSKPSEKINYEILREYVSSQFVEGLEKSFPFLSSLLEPQYSYDQESLKDQDILVNIHLTDATIYIIYILLRLGANVTVTISKELKRNEDLIKLLQSANVRFCEADKINGRYDYIMDCAGGMKDLIPRKGTIELTKTDKYDNIKTHPIILINNSYSKKVETLLGTSDGYFRALHELCPGTSFENQKIMIYGIGNVGSGIFWKASEDTNNIVIVDYLEAESTKRFQSKNPDIKVIDKSDIEGQKKELKDTFLVVTATGKDNIMEHLNVEDFSNVSFLTNIGTGKEWGEKFKDCSKLLNNGDPINFILPKPTEPEFLDLAFFILVYSLFLLSDKAYHFHNGVNDFPIHTDILILLEYGRHYEVLEDVVDIIWSSSNVPVRLPESLRSNENYFSVNSNRFNFSPQENFNSISQEISNESNDNSSDSEFNYAN